MKALTLWQPWASLVAFGEKRVETRCWRTKYRGPLAIHAAALEPKIWGQSRNRVEFYLLMCEITERHAWGDGYWPHSHHSTALGAVLCLVDLVGVEETSAVGSELSEQEGIFGNYDDGRYAWFFENIRRFETPIVAKGHQQIWNWDAPEDFLRRLA